MASLRRLLERPLVNFSLRKIRESPVESEVVQMIEHADAVLYNWIGKPRYRNTIHEMINKMNLNI